MSAEFSRREFFQRSALSTAVGAAIFLSACDEVKATVQSAPKLDSKKDFVQMGDVLSIDGRDYLLRGGKSYPIPDLEKYKKYSKLTQYGRRVLMSKADILDKYPILKSPTRETDLFIADPFTGGLKDTKWFGGEMNIYFAGFLNDDGSSYDDIHPTKGTFVDIRKKLESGNWDLSDQLFFTYGEEGLDMYQRKNTVISPVDNIKKALEFFRTLKENFPLTQFNLIAHSLGGIFAMEVARQNMDAVNNLMLISSPVKGIERNLARQTAITAASPFIKNLVGEEHVTNYLFNIWGNKPYQTELNKFGEEFTGEGRGLLVARADDDPIVPPEATKIKGAEEMVVSALKVDLMQYPMAHGRALKDPKVIDKINQMIGRNLAR